MAENLDGSYFFLGNKVAPVQDQITEIYSPIDGSSVGKVHEFTHQEIDETFEFLAKNQPAWEAVPVDQRAKALNRVADLLEENLEELSDLIVMEIAKSKKDAKDEVTRSADFVRYTAEEAKRANGETQFSDAFPGQGRNKLAVVHRVPLGIVLAIPPFNYPVNLALSKIAPGLATGNAVLLKPPTQGSVVGTYLGKLLLDAGIPKGVMAVVTGRGSRIGDYLVQHPKVSMISFTGSTETGISLAKKAGMVPLMLELGGKDAAIVLEDADLEAAAQDIVAGAFAYSGQRCTAVKRVLVSETIADQLVNLLEEKIKKLQVGDPRDNAVITPLVEISTAEKGEELISQAVNKGARLVVGGTRESNILPPALLDHVTTDMDIAWVEPFAPILPIIRVKNAQDALHIANESEYGLQAAIFSKDIDGALKLAMNLDVGSVQINGKTSRGPDHFPFVGAKNSGMGAQGVRYSIEAMTRVKTIIFNMKDPNLEKMK